MPGALSESSLVGKPDLEMPPKFGGMSQLPWEQDTMFGRMMRGEALIQVPEVPVERATRGGLIIVIVQLM